MPILVGPTPVGTPVTSSDGVLTGTFDPNSMSVLLTVKFGSVTGITTITVVRANQDGTTATVRGFDARSMPGGALAGIDHEAPMNTTCRYQATVTTSAGAVTTSTQITMLLPVLTTAWLKNLRAPALSASLVVETYPQWKYAITQGVFAVVGRPDPVVFSDVRQYGTGDLAVYTLTQPDEATLTALLGTTDPFLLQFDTTVGRPDCYVTVGNVTYTQEAPSGDPFRSWMLSLTQVGRPPTAGSRVTIPGHAYTDSTRRWVTYSARTGTYLDRATT